MNTPVRPGASERKSHMASQDVVIRRCTTTEEFKACVQLQKQVWNFADIDLIPVRLFVVADKIGGQVLGGFVGEELVGFVMAIPGSRSGHPYLHSHMLAVGEKSRNQGLG